MATLFNVRREDGKLAAQCNTRELAYREIEWQRASGVCGRLTIEEISREPDFSRWGYGYPNRFAARWPKAKIDEFYERYAAKEPVNKLAIYFGTNIGIICRMARKLGFVKRIDDPTNFEKHRGRWTRREEELVNILYDEGIGVTKIPEHHPRSQGAVTSRLRDTAAELSTRSKFGRFIRKGRGGIHRVLEEAGESAVHSEALRDKHLAKEIQSYQRSSRGD